MGPTGDSLGDDLQRNEGTMTEERNVLVTGASTGIGAACVARLAAGEWVVYAGVRRQEDGDRLVADHGEQVRPVRLDVTDRPSIDGAVERIDGEFGRLDGLVNNAGVSVGGPFELLEESEWRDQFEVNFFGVIAVTKACFPLVDRAGGRFVHIGSIAGRIAAPGMGPYAASKHAVAALNWSLRSELDGVGPMTSSVIEPGEIRTEIWNKGRGQLDDVERKMAERGLTSRYRWLLDMFRGFLDEADQRAIAPDAVAAAVEHALTSARPRARYLVGNDARLQAAAAVLPDRGREFVMGKIYERFQRNARNTPG